LVVFARLTALDEARTLAVVAGGAFAAAGGHRGPRREKVGAPAPCQRV
jgi:hypothetical protein